MLFRLLLLVLLIMAHSSSTAQSAVQLFFHLSPSEKTWTLLHPFIARKAMTCALEARVAARSVAINGGLDGDSLGGQVDAFRHSFWMARCAQEFSPKKALRLGKAHERANYKNFKKRISEDGALADSVLCEMDLFNNAVGVAIGKEFRQVSADSLAGIVIRAILAGKMKIIWKDLRGEPLDCSGKPVNQALYRGVWGIPKCLVPSNHTASKQNR